MTVQERSKKSDLNDKIDERVLWVDYIDDSNEISRQRLIKHYLPLAERIAKIQYARAFYKNIEYNDYLQYANIGLIEALDRFEPSKDTAFSTYAIYRIKGSIINGLEKFTEKQHMYAFIRRNRVERSESLNTQNKKRISDSNSNSLFDHLQTLVASMAIGYLLEQPDIHNHQLTETGKYMSLPEMDHLRGQLSYFVDVLPEKEKLIVTLHYYQGESFVDIANIMAVSKSRVSQLHKNALLAIRKVYSKQQSFKVSY